MVNNLQSLVSFPIEVKSEGLNDDHLTMGHCDHHNCEPATKHSSHNHMTEGMLPQLQLGRSAVSLLVQGHRIFKQSLSKWSLTEDYLTSAFLLHRHIIQWTFSRRQITFWVRPSCWLITWMAWVISLSGEGRWGKQTENLLLEMSSGMTVHYRSICLQ